MSDGMLVRREADRVIFPGFCDVHVHFREPGFSYKETMITGARAAAHGGYTDVCAMPNLNPVPDSPEHLAEEERLIRGAAEICRIHPYGSLTVEEKGEAPADLRGMAGRVVAFSDDGRGVQSESMMRSLMETCAGLGKIVTAHCEDNALVRGGYIHDGAYAHDHSGQLRNGILHELAEHFLGEISPVGELEDADAAVVAGLQDLLRDCGVSVIEDGDDARLLHR